MEKFLVMNRYLRALHFTFHGVHHMFPLDKDRLLLPVPIALIIWYSIKVCVQIFIPENPMIAFAASATLGYLNYDLTHYYLHHHAPMTGYKFLKRYHMFHHYKDPDNGYGVSTPLWDYVFGTTLDMTKNHQKKRA
mmetsp:Transcript_8780/g.8327  ORF Transcript_8780/g.8327 Transcript_8780/m.8327 type:complete len:135 (+) Transcript_8780:249-653(+)